MMGQDVLPPTVYALEILYNLRNYVGWAAHKQAPVNAAHIDKQLAALAVYFEKTDDYLAETPRKRKPK
jgi:hypothetical protein